MARKQVNRQLRLFGVGDLGDEDDGRKPPDGRRPWYESWPEASVALGHLLRETKFEAYLARQDCPDDQGDGC